MRVKALMIDLEGTLYESGHLVDGADVAIAQLRSAGYAMRFCTNTDSKSVATLVRQLSEIGLDVHSDEIHTPITAARAVLSGMPDARPLLLMDEEAATELGESADSGPFTHVVVADCRETLNYPVLDAAFGALRQGALLVALQKGRYFKRADGDHLDTGAIVAALEYASESTALVLGKPNDGFFATAAASMGVTPAEVAVIGDDGTTDIAMGTSAGAVTIQVRTGKYRDQAGEGSGARADHTIDSIGDLPSLLREMA